MKVGVRKPSVTRSVKARTTGRVKREVKKSVTPFYGEKGTGWVKDPEKALYNKAYHKTTVGVSDAVRVAVGDKYKAPNDSNIDCDYYGNSDCYSNSTGTTISPKIGMFLIVSGIVIVVMSLVLMVVYIIPGLVGVAFGVYCVIKGRKSRKQSKQSS